MILDPFVGNGTIAVAAKILGKNYIGIDLNEKYVKIAEKRLKELDEEIKRLSIIKERKQNILQLEL